MKKKRLIALCAIAAAIGFVAIGGLATMATPVDALRHGNVAARTAAPVHEGVPLVGTFTGAYADGVPVYRLPPLAVSANRKTELAKIEQEERMAQAAQADVAAVASAARQEVAGPAQTAPYRVIVTAIAGK